MFPKEKIERPVATTRTDAAIAQASQCGEVRCGEGSIGAQQGSVQIRDEKAGRSARRSRSDAAVDVDDGHGIRSLRVDGYAIIGRKRARRQAGCWRLKSACAYGDISTTAPEGGSQRRQRPSPACRGALGAADGGRVFDDTFRGSDRFFDKLGFRVGNRPPHADARESSSVLAEEDQPSRSLIEMIETLLSEKPII